MYLIGIILLASAIKAEFLCGCCEEVCIEAPENFCNEDLFHLDAACDDLDVCDIGCCLDQEGYCFTNYLRGNCERNNNSFEQMSCMDVYDCTLVLDEFGIIGYTGFSPFYDPSVLGDGFSHVHPTAARRGTTFTIGYYVHNTDDVARVRARIMDGTTTVTTLTLYDDSYHLDRNAGDHFYANWWRSNGVSVSGMKQLTVDYILTANDGTSETYENLARITLTSTDCMPIENEWGDPSRKIDVIFVSNNYDISDNDLWGNVFLNQLRGGTDDFAADVELHLEQLNTILPFSRYLNETNIYRVDRRYNTGVTSLRNRVKTQCNFYNENQDIIIALDKNMAECFQPYLGMARTHPLTSYANPNLQRTRTPNFPTLSSAIHDYCYFANTIDDAIDYSADSLQGPTPQILTTPGTTYRTADVEIEYMIIDNAGTNIDFTAFALADDDIFEILLENIHDITREDLEALTDDQLTELLEDINYVPFIAEASGTAQNGASGTITIPDLEDGDYLVWIEAIDADGNLGGSDIVDIVVDIDMFHIVVNTPVNNSVVTTNTLDLNFGITHKLIESIPYSIRLDGVFFHNGQLMNNGVTSYGMSSLADGQHTVVISASDSLGVTKTKTITFTVNTAGNPSPPMAGPDVILTSILVIILTFLIGVFGIFYEKKL